MARAHQAAWRDQRRIKVKNEEDEIFSRRDMYDGNRSQHRHRLWRNCYLSLALLIGIFSCSAGVTQQC